MLQWTLVCLYPFKLVFLFYFFNSFIEVEVTYHKTYPFKKMVYSSTSLANLYSWVIVTQSSLRTHPPPHRIFTLTIPFLFSSCKDSEVKSLSHATAQFLVFWRNSILFFTVAAPIYTPTSTWIFPFLHNPHQH